MNINISLILAYYFQHGVMSQALTKSGDSSLNQNEHKQPLELTQMPQHNNYCKETKRMFKEDD